MASSAAVSPLSVAGPLRLEPFRGLMLSASRVGDPASARAFARPYRDVAQRLRRWEDQGRIHRDATPAVYVHEYTSGGITIRGLVGALDLSHRTDDPRRGVVMPHEAVHPEQAVDLAARMSEMGLNPAPILLVHRGPERVRALVSRTTEAAPDHEFSDRLDQVNRVWAITDPATLHAIDAGLADARVLLADGHHRYAAYLQMQAEAPGTAADRGLAMLVDQDDTPLYLGAIHRLLAGVTLDEALEAGRRVGTAYEATHDEALEALAPTTIALTDGERWAALALEPHDDQAAVEVVHGQLIPRLATAPRRVGYHHSLDETLADLRRTAGVALVMPAPDFDVVRQILAADRLLPEKATSFQPKPSLGVLMRSLRDG